MGYRTFSRDEMIGGRARFQKQLLFLIYGTQLFTICRRAASRQPPSPAFRRNTMIARRTFSVAALKRLDFIGTRQLKAFIYFSDFFFIKEEIIIIVSQ